MKHHLCPPELRLTTVLFGLAVFLCGCSSSYTVSSTGMPNAEYGYQEMNEELKGRHVTIELKDGEEITAEEATIFADSISWVDANTAEKTEVATRQVKRIVITNHLVGALEGMGFGLLVGGTAGIILQSSSKPNAAGVYFPWEAGAGAGLVVGLLPGIIIGHSYEYEFSTIAQSDSLRNGK